jgi:hypothetical protein
MKITVVDHLFATLVPHIHTYPDMTGYGTKSDHDSSVEPNRINHGQGGILREDIARTTAGIL